MKDDLKTDFLIFKSILGNIKLSGKNGFITSLEFIKIEPTGGVNTFLNDCKEQILAYLDGKLKKFSCKYILRGTDFQLKVWKELIKIPYGEVISYKELAARIGNPKAYRAVANANSKNKIPLIIPCHLVIYANGALGGYSSGIEKKRFLLQLESGKN